MELKVIDVSEHQGTIDWNTVKNNIDGAILRCGYGSDYSSQDDKQWKRNADECTRLGIPFGVYLYSYATTEDQARSEAQHVLRCISEYEISYPVYLDLEESGTQSGAVSRANVFGDIIEDAGYSCGVYANTNWWTNYLVGLERFTKWVAQYNSVCTYSGSYDMWQYTSSGYVPGISGAVDMNYCYRDFPSEIAGNSEKEGWVLDSNGWWYRNADGSYPKNCWKEIGGDWYYFDAKGYALDDGWFHAPDGAWYYLKSDCRMYTGWLKDNEEWYYLNTKDETGHPKGSMMTGWTHVDSYWYYMDESGKMLSGLFDANDGYSYYCRPENDGNPQGSCYAGWLLLDNTWYYFNESLNCQPWGSMLKSHWVESNGNRFYLKEDGKMAANETLTISSETYTFNAAGELEE